MGEATEPGPHMSAGPHTGYTQCNRATLIASGGAYFDRMVALIDGAHQCVHLQVYIFANDRTGARIGEALVRAATRGVQVYLIVDAFASAGIARDLVARLVQAGGHFRFFEPLFSSRHWYFGRRMHHKVLVADQQHALVSGRNVAERYDDVDGQRGWLDMALEVEGKAATELDRLCYRVWNGTMRKEGDKRAVPPTTKEAGTVACDIPPDQRCTVRVRYNDWLRRQTRISASYQELFREARGDIQLVSAYFLPGLALRRAMRQAADRGVRITLIMGDRSDVRIARLAGRWFHAWLLRHGIEVFAYQHQVLHAKLAVRDGCWCTLGSFNLNDLSAYTTTELNLDVDNERLAGAMRLEVLRIAHEECQQVTAAIEQRTGSGERLLRWAAYHTLSLAYRFVTFYYRRE